MEKAMNILIRTGALAFTSSIILLLPFFAYAAGLDDAVNYESKPIIAASTSVQAYTIQDIINKLPDALNNDGVYNSDSASMVYKKLDEDPRITAFNKEKFGECEAFYLYHFGSAGKGGFESVLRFSFPENDDLKTNASRGIKHSLAYLKESSQGPKCANREKHLVQIKEIFNAVIQAAPMILQEKQRLVAMEHAEKLQKQDQANNRVSIKQQAENKAKSDKQANEFAEAKGREERSKKLNACQNTNGYRLYAVSATINNNQVIAKNSRLEMQHQEEGAKISGFVDKQVMYEMGNRIAGVSRLNKENFEIYKKLGGSARNVESVNELPDPCKW